jgi:Ala-tRNA(Pro) deacylase
LHVLFSTQQITPATEAKFKFAFHDCEVGAMPPFGNLYEMEVFVAKSLTDSLPYNPSEKQVEDY